MADGSWCVGQDGFICSGLAEHGGDDQDPAPAAAHVPPGGQKDGSAQGRIRPSSEITQAELSGQLGRARQVASSASLLRDPGVQARFADPPAEAVELSRALVRAFAEAGDVRNARAAAVVAPNAFRKLQEHMAAAGAEARSRS
jgi:hypothetical protein